MATCRVRSNFQAFLDECEEMAAAFRGRRGVKIHILNNVEYFLYIEYGTDKIAARAMVRNAYEPVIRMFDDLWQNYLTFPCTPDDIDTLADLVKDYWIEEILKRTPEITGLLKAGFYGEVEKY